MAGKLSGLRLLPLCRPSLDLALDVSVAPGQIAQANLVYVDGVEVGEYVDQVLRHPPSQHCRKFRGALDTIEHDTVDEAHHVERCADYVDIDAETEHRWDGHVGAADR